MTQWSRMSLAATAAVAVGVLTACAGDGDPAADPTAGPTGAPAVTDNVALAALPAPGDVDLATGAYPGPADTFVAAVTGTDYFLGISLVDGDAAGYLCDGEVPLDLVADDPVAFEAAVDEAARSARSAWLTGEVEGTTVTLTGPDGAGFTGELDGDTLSGTVTLPDGATHELTLTRVPGTTGDGLYRRSTARDDLTLSGGWVVLGGQVRGKQTVAIAGQAIAEADQVLSGLGDEVDAAPPADGVEPTLFKKRRCAKLAGMIRTLEVIGVAVFPQDPDNPAPGESQEAFDQIKDYLDTLYDKFDRLKCDRGLL